MGVFILIGPSEEFMGVFLSYEKAEERAKENDLQEYEYHIRYFKVIE